MAIPAHYRQNIVVTRPAEPCCYVLPNGLTVEQCNRYETDFVYREVFVERIYTRAFADLPPIPAVIDVGSNIGLFSLFIKEHYPQARVYGFEPAPALFKLASHNLAAYRDVTLHACGLGAAPGKQTFTYYPHYSLLSGFHGNVQQDAALLRAGIVEQLQHKEDADHYLELLTEGKLEEPQQFTCEIITLSSFIAREKFARVDLLKIDAEKAELDVLRGISSADWPKIIRVVIEAHSHDSANKVETLLLGWGFQVQRQLNARHQDTEIYILTAQR